MRNFVRLIAIAVVAAGFVQSIFASDRWEPRETHAVIVGVLKWSDKSLSSFSTTNRKDQEFRDLLVKRGVPAENVTLLLDKDATREKIYASLRKTASAAKPGATLIVYYAGHGMKVERDFCFANYDLSVNRPQQTGLMLGEIGEILAARFTGGRVLLFAVCCHSGGLAAVVRRLEQAKIPAASLTSADASNLSTGNWTFTQTILDGLAGDPLADANRDGAITLAELHSEVESAMKYLEGQRSGFAIAGIPSDFILAKVSSTAAPSKIDAFPVGSYVTAPEKGRRRPARVIGANNDGATVQFYDYTEKRSVNVRENQLAKLVYKRYALGESLNVLWEGKIWKAKVMKTDGDFHLIHYDDYNNSSDEWVLANRIVPANEIPDSEAQWQGTWYPAKVLKKENGKWLVHYTGFEDSWDEWVGKDRIRFPKT